MINFFGKYWKNSLFIYLASLVLSYAAFNFNLVNSIVFWLIIIVTFILSLKDLKWGLLILLGELFIGSKGYLFSGQITENEISLRLGIFLVVLAAWVLTKIKNKDFNYRNIKIVKPFFLLLLFIGISVIIAFAGGNSFDNIFFDLNGYLYFALFFLFFDLIKRTEIISQIIQVLTAALTALLLQSLLLVYIFGHKFIYTMPSLYSWVRDFGLGEITELTSNFYRVFFQSQIFALFLFLIALAGWFLWRKSKDSQNRRNLSLAIIISSAIILVSFSRSFWLGLVAGLLALCGLVLFKQNVKFSALCQKSLSALVLIIIALVIVFGITNFPFPRLSSTTSLSLIKSRATEDLTSEAAAASRWELLPILWGEVKEAPIIGQGFGTTVTYQTADPRFLESHPDGLYTTYAFEWTYLDIWIKMGFFGLLAYGYFLFFLLRQGWQLLKKQNDNYLVLGLLAALICFLALNITTPYLNHPLGIGWLMLTAAILQHKSQPADPTA